MKTDCVSLECAEGVGITPEDQQWINAHLESAFRDAIERDGGETFGLPDVRALRYTVTHFVLTGDTPFKEMWRSVGDAVTSPQGRIANRIARYWYKRRKIKLPATVKERIGQLAVVHRLPKGEYKFQFTDEFDWTPGTYGDAGSCYWGARRPHALDFLKNAGGVAVLIHAPRKARCWLVPIDVETRKRTDWAAATGFVAFNAYGLPLSQIVAVLVQFTGFRAKRIETLRNNNRWDGCIYINEAGRGYCLAPPALLKTFDNQAITDLEISETLPCPICNSPGQNCTCIRCQFCHTVIDDPYGCAFVSPGPLAIYACFTCANERLYYTQAPNVCDLCGERPRDTLRIGHPRNMHCARDALWYCARCARQSVEAAAKTMSFPVSCPRCGHRIWKVIPAFGIKRPPSWIRIALIGPQYDRQRSRYGISYIESLTQIGGTPP